MEVFNAFIGGYSGPSSYYYINRTNNDYEFKYGYSEYGKIIKNMPNNKDLSVNKKSAKFYCEFEKSLLQLTKNWQENYDNNDVMDGTQWNIEFNKNKKYSGSNEYPKNWQEVINYLDKIFNNK